MPRRLAHEFEDGNLNSGEFLLLAYLGAAGLGHYGVSTTNPQLASVLHVRDRTIQRYLRALRERGWIQYPTHQGSPRFRILPGERLTSDSTSDTTSDTAGAPGVRSSHDVVRSREAVETPSAPSFAPRSSPPAVRGDKEEDDEETQPSISKGTAELHASTSGLETDDDALLAALGLGSTTEREVLAALALEFPGTLAYWRDESGVRVQRVEELGG